MACRYCGQELAENAAFCAFCGKPAGGNNTQSLASSDDRYSPMAATPRLGLSAPSKVAQFWLGFALLILVVGAAVIYDSPRFRDARSQSEVSTTSRSSASAGATAQEVGRRYVGPSDEEIRSAVASMLKAGLRAGELCDVSGVAMNTGARNVKVNALEITRRGVYDEQQKTLKVMVRASGTFETSLEDWDFFQSPPNRLVWCPCAFGGETEYTIHPDGYGGWRVAPFLNMPFAGLKPKFLGIPKNARTR